MLGACLSDSAKADGAARYPTVNYTDTSPHKSAFAHVNGVKLNYLDWGGDGPPLVMIHGIGDDPHVFDDLASLLRDRFRIVAYARRGHGLSESIGPYDGNTLVEDLKQLLDHLGIQRARMIGWSMGGNEMTAFAGRYPERVERIVYLESGYDWSTPFFFKAFETTLAANNPTATDMASLDAVRIWYRRAWLGNNVTWSVGLEAYLRDLAQPDATASCTRSRPTKPGARYLRRSPVGNANTPKCRPRLSRSMARHSFRSIRPILYSRKSCATSTRTRCCRSGAPAWSASNAS